jgi:hypothetical protein
MDARTAARVKPTAERLVNATTNELAGKQVDRDRESAGVETLLWAQHQVESIKRAARSGARIVQAYEDYNTLVERLDSAVAGGQITSLQRAALLERAQKEPAQETYIGDHEDASSVGKGPEFTAKFKANPPKELSTDDVDKLVSHFEAQDARSRDEKIKGKGLEIFDAVKLFLPNGTAEQWKAYALGKLDKNDVDAPSIRILVENEIDAEIARRQVKTSQDLVEDLRNYENRASAFGPSIEEDAAFQAVGREANTADKRAVFEKYRDKRWMEQYRGADPKVRRTMELAPNLSPVQQAYANSYNEGRNKLQEVQETPEVKRVYNQIMDDVVNATTVEKRTALIKKLDLTDLEARVSQRMLDNIRSSIDTMQLRNEAAIRQAAADKRQGESDENTKWLRDHAQALAEADRRDKNQTQFYAAIKERLDNTLPEDKKNATLMERRSKILNNAQGYLLTHPSWDPKNLSEILEAVDKMFLPVRNAKGETRFSGEITQARGRQPREVWDIEGINPSDPPLSDVRPGETLMDNLVRRLEALQARGRDITITPESLRQLYEKDKLYAPRTGPDTTPLLAPAQVPAAVPPAGAPAVAPRPTPAPKPAQKPIVPGEAARKAQADFVALIKAQDDKKKADEAAKKANEVAAEAKKKADKIAAGEKAAEDLKKRTRTPAQVEADRKVEAAKALEILNRGKRR